jgi:hypothetical protein
LYGPQEDDLHKESVNPICFTKTRRQLLVETEADMVKLPLLSLSDLKKQLTARGLSDSGDRAVLSNRYLRLRERDLKAVSKGGELSLFANEHIHKMFSKIKKSSAISTLVNQARGDEGSSVILWEMNRLLMDTHAGGTIHDNIEYRRFIQGTQYVYFFS